MSLGKRCRWLVVVVVPWLAFCSVSLSAAPPHRVYSHLLEPREHLDYNRRAVKPPNGDTFKNRTQFNSLRGFNIEKDQIVGYKENSRSFTRIYEIGNLIRPSYPILFATNLANVAAASELRGSFHQAIFLRISCPRGCERRPL